MTVIQDNVGYLPTINAPATQMYTVNEVLNQSLSIMQSLNQTKIVCVFDQALYATAVEITWKHPDKFQNTIIDRLGVFHTICTLLSTIGKRFQDAVLRDLCIESGVIAEGSIAGVMVVEGITGQSDCRNVCTRHSHEWLGRISNHDWKPLMLMMLFTWMKL